MHSVHSIVLKYTFTLMKVAEMRTYYKLVINFLVVYDEKVTPVPIPNTAVKLLSADDTWMVASRENRSLPDLYQDLELIAQGLFIL